MPQILGGIMFIEALAITAVLGGLYKYRASIVAKIKGVPTVVAAKGTAFARLAEQEGKVVALKAASKAKTEEAKLIHAGLDEFDKLIG